MNRLYLEGDISISLVSLHVSFCKMHSVISISSNTDFQTTNILHTHFSNNYIRTDLFLLNRMFSKLVILDLGNPIIYFKLIIFEKNQNLWILSILKAKVALTNARLSSSLVIATDDALLCCYIANTEECFTSVVLKCFGLINNSSAYLLIICVVTFLACIIVVSSTGTYLYLLITQGLKNALFLVLFNIGISDLLSCIYISCIIVADWKKVTILYWQTGNMCKILQQLLTLLLILNVILRCTASLILLARITYPFIQAPV